MEHKLLVALILSAMLTGCHPEQDKAPPKEKIDEVAMRDGGRDEKPNMFDLRQDALQEDRTRGRVCHGYDCEDDQYYYYSE